MRRRDQVCLLINHEDDRCNDTDFRGKRRLHDLDGVRRPIAAKESLVHFEERGAVSFNYADNDHDEISVGVKLCGMMDSVVNFFGTSDFLGERESELDGQQFAELVDDVEWRVEYQIPAVKIFKFI